MAAVETEGVLMQRPSERIDDAVIWATAHWWNSPRPLLPHLKKKFDLTDAEAMEAIRGASDAIIGSPR